MRRRLGVALLVATSVVLAACSEDEPDAAAPSSSSSQPSPTSISTTPTPTPPPTLPPEAATADGPGADVFVRHWYELFAYASDTGDTRPLVSASRSDCTFCANIIEQIDSDYRLGYRYEGGDITLTSIASPPLSGTGYSVANVILNQSAGRTVDRNGSVVEEGDGSTNLPVQVEVERAGDRWFVSQVDNNPAGS